MLSLVAAAFVLISIGGTAVTAQTHNNNFTIAYSGANLLSCEATTPSTCTACADVNASGCTKGLASAVQVVRTSREAGDDVLFIPQIDQGTAFVQMHPKTWGVNGEIFDYFGTPLYAAKPSLLTSTREGLKDLYNSSTRTKPLMTNVVLSPTDPWYGIPVPVYVHNHIAIMNVLSENTPISAAAVASCSRLLDLFNSNNHAGNSKIRATIILIQDEVIDVVDFTVAVNARTRNFPTLVLHRERNIGQTIINGTVVMGAKGTSSSRVTFVTLNFTNGGTGDTISKVSAREISLSLKAAQKDSQYFLDQAYLATQIALAAENDPVVGTTLKAMPLGRSADSTFRLCVTGECPQGNLFTDAMRWTLGTDIAITASGGLRGPGWPAGPVKVSNLWQALPFANTMCTATILGLTIFEMFNYSYTQAQYTSVKTATGDRLLQLSGARVVVNSQLPTSKLLSVEILDKESNTYRPLERLKLYTVGVDSYAGYVFEPFNTYLDPEYQGEVDKVATTQLVQDAVADYLEATPNWDSAAQSPRIRDDTTNTSSMDWVQTQATCVGNSSWNASVATCVPCEWGFEQLDQGSAFCTPRVTPIPEAALDFAESNLITTFSVLAALLLAALVLFVLFKRFIIRPSRRDLYCVGQFQVNYEAKPLGQGAFGVVYKGYDNERGINIAVKESKVAAMSEKELDAMRSEFELLQSLNHPNVVSVYGMHVDEENSICSIFMEFMSQGSIAHIMHENKFRLHENVIKRYLKATLDGLVYLHARKVLHRDIKSANILVDNGIAKLSDFGTSTKRQGNGATAETMKLVGTCAFMAPEVIRGRFSEASDIWALGCAVVEMGSGCLPWSHLEPEQREPMPLMFHIGTEPAPPDHHPEIPDQLSPNLRGLLKKMFAPDPKDRPSAQQLRKSSYFHDRNKSCNVETRAAFTEATHAVFEYSEEMSGMHSNPSAMVEMESEGSSFQWMRTGEMARLVEEEEEADEDRALRERVEARNALEQSAYGVRNRLKDEDTPLNLDQDDRATLEAAVEDAIEFLNNAAPDADKAEFNAATETLLSVANPLLS